MRPSANLEAKAKLTSKRLWMLTTVTFVLVIVFTILAVVAYFVLTGGRFEGPGIRGEVVDGLAARVLLDRCEGADMLVLGTSSDETGEPRSAGPVIRACLRRASCPVVVISADKDPMQRREHVAAGCIKVPAGV